MFWYWSDALDEDSPYRYKQSYLSCSCSHLLGASAPTTPGHTIPIAVHWTMARAILDGRFGPVASRPVQTTIGARNYQRETSHLGGRHRHCDFSLPIDNGCSRQILTGIPDVFHRPDSHVPGESQSPVRASCTPDATKAVCRYRLDPSGETAKPSILTSIRGVFRRFRRVAHRSPSGFIPDVFEDAFSPNVHDHNH